MSQSTGVALQSRLKATAERLNGGPISDVLTNTLVDLFTNLVMSCLGGSNPSTDNVTKAIRGAATEPVYQSILKARCIRAVRRQNMSRDDGLLANQTLTTALAESTEDELKFAVAHVKDADQSFPEVDMF